jgi:hypothetical protein
MNYYVSLQKQQEREENRELCITKPRAKSVKHNLPHDDQDFSRGNDDIFVGKINHSHR